MKYLRCLIMLLVLLPLAGCDDAVDQLPPLEPHQFAETDDPKVFFAYYLEDLKGDRFLPADLFKMLAERTRMKEMVKPFKRHDPYALLEWYYSPVYLDKVQQALAPDLEQMSYQLDVMNISEELATKIMMVAEAGPIEHKRQLLEGGIEEQWNQFDETRYEVLLRNGDWQQLIGIGLENGRWKIRIFNKTI